jgi:hypothetical protein
MSASAPAAEPCPDCGEPLPAGARYCPSCGSDLGAGQVPAWESPVAYRQAEPHWFGVAPPPLLLGIGVVLVVLALVLFATGHWPYGLIVLGVGALLLAAFLEAAKRRPENHAFLRTSAHARERAQTAMETWRVRSAAAAEVRRVRHALALLDADRRGLLLELGTAAHRGDAGAEASLRGRLTELDATERRLRSELDSALTEAGERIRQARLPVEETMMVLPTEPLPPEPLPPEPLPPDPGPPPGEADPPEPAVVPEPYPPPDEADPPQPARVPEPGPGRPEER